MARYKRNRLVGEILARDNTAGLPLWDHAVAATAPRKVPTGDRTRDASYAATIEGEIVESQRLVLKAIREIGPCSDRAAANHLGIGINRVTGRRGELLDLGLITEAGETYDEETHRHVTLWRVL